EDLPGGDHRSDRGQRRHRPLEMTRLHVLDQPVDDMGRPLAGPLDKSHGCPVSPPATAKPRCTPPGSGAHGDALGNAAWTHAPAKARRRPRAACVGTRRTWPPGRPGRGADVRPAVIVTGPVRSRRLVDAARPVDGPG